MRLRDAVLRGIPLQAKLLGRLVRHYLQLDLRMVLSGAQRAGCLLSVGYVPPAELLGALLVVGLEMHLSSRWP